MRNLLCLVQKLRCQTLSKIFVRDIRMQRPLSRRQIADLTQPEQQAVTHAQGLLRGRLARQNKDKQLSSGKVSARAKSEAVRALIAMVAKTHSKEHFAEIAAEDTSKPLVRTPERRPSRLEARRGLSTPPQAA